MKTKTRTPFIRLVIEVEAELAAAFDEKVVDQGQSRAAVVRNLIRDWVEKRDGK